jgi:hypothetical protein
MKQQNFLFVDLVSSIFLLLLLVGNFMGLLYISDGSVPLSLLGTMFLVVCYFFTIQQLKKNKEVMFRKNFLHASLVFWFFFLMLSIISFNLMSHFINIEYNCKYPIRNEAATKIKLVESLVSEYEQRANTDIEDFGVNLKEKLESYAATKNPITRDRLKNAPYKISNEELIGLNANSAQAMADQYTSIMEGKINKDLKNLKAKIKNDNENYQKVFDNWQRFKLVSTYSKLNEYVEQNIKLINSKIIELPYNNKQVNPEYPKNQLPLNSPSKLNAMPEFKPSYLTPTIFIILTHLFILIPFFTWKIPDYGSTKEVDPLEIENVREI